MAEELEEGDNHTTINLHQNKCREMLAGRGGQGEEWNTFSWGGSTNPPYSAINYLLERAGI